MEQPNLNYIQQLSRGDKTIETTLIDVIKTEFPKEKQDYYNSIEKKNFKEIEENVHKLKHKISILGLEKSYDMANEFEHNLRNTNFSRKEEFDETLIVISNFIQTL
jgi:HPt (histidine-containing phosphotransfer) domain-containing protein